MSSAPAFISACKGRIDETGRTIAATSATITEANEAARLLKQMRESEVWNEECEATFEALREVVVNGVRTIAEADIARSAMQALLDQYRATHDHEAWLRLGGSAQSHDGAGAGAGGASAPAAEEEGAAGSQDLAAKLDDIVHSRLADIDTYIRGNDELQRMLNHSVWGSGDGDLEEVDEEDTVDKLRCPLTQRLFENPVKISVCGHRFDKAGLNALMRRQSKHTFTCPQAACSKKFAHKDVVHDSEMAARVALFKEKEELATQVM